MDTPIYNFCAGPAALPPEVLEQLREDLVPHGTPTLLESSHRTPAYKELMARTLANLRTLLGLGDAHTLLLLQGGASGQFAMLPYNFLRPGETADYLVRGYWGDKAARQAARVSRVRTLTEPGDWNSSAVYAHVTTNETIAGTALPETFVHPVAPLCADMSSDILARPRDYGRYEFFYAGAQKNLGVAGLAVVGAEKEFLSRARRNLPAAFCYLEHTHADGLYHTPNIFAVNALFRMTEWMLARGTDDIFAANERKARRLYAELDRSSFWRPLAPKDERSLTNVTFRLPTASLEEDFLAGAERAGLTALRGHRALGGIRASLYNAMPEAGVDALVAFMQEFERRNG